MGCQVTVEMDGGDILGVTGYTCKRGLDYAQKEVTDPTRIVTSTVRVLGGAHPFVAVKTARDIPKGKIRDAMAALRGLAIPAPVSIGDVVLPDTFGLGCEVVATQNCGAG
ncbi:MAG: DUF1667 domain-containing protein [Lachnospiraceae bacterium]|nr:DUF1667 domain-containing protein [Lachnospiraceae bacterium]